MIVNVPTHLLKQEIVVVSGGLTYDEYGVRVFDQTVVASGLGRLETTVERLVDAGNVIHFVETGAWVAPTMSGSIGDFVQLADGKKFRIGLIDPRVDGRGVERLKKWILKEVEE